MARRKRSLTCFKARSSMRRTTSWYGMMATFISPIRLSRAPTTLVNSTFNGIFHVTPRGELDVIAKWQTRPNGIALSSDGKTLFVTDSDRHAVVAFDLDGRGRSRQSAGSHQEYRGRARRTAGRRERASLRGGERPRDLFTRWKARATLLAGESITNCAFGDSDSKSLYVTGRKNIYRIRLGVKGAIPY